MRRIILIGYMGAGKTTLGQQLAKELGLTFYDLDWFIERRFCKTIADLFAERGETGFRKLEQEMLREVIAMEDVVVSAGGGTPCFFDNMAEMNDAGETVYLQASVDNLFHHLEKGRAKLPLLRGKSDVEMRAYIAQSLAQRESFYLQAKHRFTVTPLRNAKDVAAATAALNALLADAQKSEV